MFDASATPDRWNLLMHQDMRKLLERPLDIRTFDRQWR
jgi:hypothetical protein